MSVELLQTLSLISFIVAGVALLVAIALFFLLDIRKVVGNLSGATARKAIRNIRLQNENAADNDYSAATDRITRSGRIERQAANETTILMPATAETTILNAGSGATQPLQSILPASAKQPAYAVTDPASAAVFVKEIEMGFTDSTEIIE